jgi:hypothetical protein
MAVTVPSTDLVNYTLQAQIAAVQALVNAPTINPAQNQQNLQTLYQLQCQLVYNLMNNTNARSAGAMGGLGLLSYVNPATVLSTLSINT